MVSVLEHYSSHLAPIYVWMAGGAGPALGRGREEISAACPLPRGQQLAVDLGAGFGMHAIPLAELGYTVLAIDGSRELLERLRSEAGSLPVKALEVDLISFRRYLESPAALILCMGDTLTHLVSREAVETLFSEVAGALSEDGRFIATFRDYSSALEGVKRFIPVRSDAERILTCFLEYRDDTVTVHDILHEREGAGWRQRVSAYQKLRLSPEWVVSALQDRGLRAQQEAGPAGMVRIVAVR